MKRISNILSILLLAITFNVASLYAAPSTQAKSIAFTNITSNSAKITWINGNGGHRIVVLYNADIDQQAPSNLHRYGGDSAKTVYGDGTQLTNGNTIGYVVYSGTGSTRSVSVTNLTAGTEYYARVYESNNIPSSFNYNVNTANNNPRGFKTSIEVPEGLATSNVLANSATASWNEVVGANGYVLDMNMGSDNVDEYSDIDLGDVTTYDFTYLTENTGYNWTVAAYNNDDQSAYASRVSFTTVDDVTPPTFTVQYFYDDNYTMPLFTQDDVVGEGTYYLMVTSSEPLPTTPTVTIAAAGGTINDRSSVSTNQISNTTFAYTRVVEFDENSDNGMDFELISVTGNDGNGNIGTTNDLEGLKIDTKAPELDAFGLADNFTMDVEFTEGVRDASSMFNHENGVDTDNHLTASNFNVDLVNESNSGVTDVMVTNVTRNSASSYTLTLEYEYSADMFGAPYQGTPGVTLEVVNTEDIIGNSFEEYTTGALDLTLTPVKNVTTSAYYETLEDAIAAASDSDNLLFAPTTIDVANSISTSTSLSFDGYDATNLLLAADITFDDATVDFTGTTGMFAITEDVAGSTLEFNNSDVNLENITLDADVNANGTDVNTFDGIYLTVNSNMSITGNTTTLETSDFNTADGIALEVSFANVTLTEVNFYNNETGISYTGDENYLLDINAGYFYNASSTAILVNNSNANIFNFPTFEDNETAIQVSGETGYLTMYESDVINNGTGVWVDGSTVTVENINFYDNTTAINVNTTFDITVNISEFTGNGVAINIDAASSINVSDNIFDSEEVAIQNNSATEANAVSNYYGSNLGPTVTGNQCGNGASISGPATWEPWYISSDLTDRASTVKNNVISTSTPEYCAYVDSEAQFSGSMHTGGLLDGDDNSIGYTYTWYVNDVAVDNSDVQSLVDYILDVAGTYTIRRDIETNDCIYASNEVEVIVNELPAVPMLSTTSGELTFCYGDEITIQVDNINAVDYQWFEGQTELDGETGSTLTVDEDGTFRVEATNEHGCIISSEEITVDELPMMTLAINNGDALYESCSDEVVELTSSVTPMNDVYTYSWMLGNTEVGTDATYTPSESGIYTLTATNVTTGIGCTISDDIEVIINELPTTPIISGDMTACYNESVTLSVSNYIVGDLANYDLTWYDSDDNYAGSGLTLDVDFANIAGTSASYYVVATNLMTGCDVVTDAVTVNELPELMVTVENEAYCSNATAISLEAVATDANNSDYDYTYQWYDANTDMAIPDATNSTYTHVGTTPGTYNYYVIATLATDNEGCTVMSEDATVTVYQLAEPVISGDNLNTEETDRVCEGQDFTFTVTNENMDGEAAADSYQWYFEGTPVGNDSPTLEITNAMLNQEGVYTVEITTIHGCTTESAEFNLDVTPLAVVTGLTFTTNSITSGDLTEGQQTDFREDLDITYNVTATDAVSYKWWFESQELDETSSSLTLTYDAIDMLDGVADNMYEGTDIFANPINTFTVQAEAVSAEECVNDFSVSVELNVVPVPTWIEIVAIPTRTDGDDNNDIDIPANETEFMVTVRAKNNLDFLSNVIANTNLTLALNGGTLVTSEFNNGNTITITEGQSSVTFPVVLTKKIGETGLTLTAIVDDATTNNDLMDGLKGSDDGVQNMNTDYATSNEFVLIPTKPNAPTSPVRVSRSRTTLTLKSTVTNPSGMTLYSMIVAKQSAVNPTNDLTPADGQAFTAHATLGNVTADIVGDGYQAIYFGSARQVTMAGLTKSTIYSIKYYAVAGDFIAAKTATYRYSDNLKHDGVATSNKESDELEFVSESDAPFTVSAIFPNPVKDVLNFNVTNTEAANYKVEVMTATGQIVSVPFTDLQLGAGTSSHNFNLQGVAAGSYMLIVTSGDHAFVVPFVVMP